MQKKVQNIVQGIRHFESEDLIPVEYVRKPRYLRKDLGIEARNLVHWEKMGILLKKHEVGTWFKFSLAEAFWLKIVQELRSFNISLESIKSLKDYLNANMKIDTEAKMPEELYQAILTMDKNVTYSELEKIFSPEFLNEIQNQMKPTLLENLIISLIAERIDIRILLNEKGDGLIVRNEVSSNSENDEELKDFLSKSYLNLSMMNTLKRLVKTLGEVEFEQNLSILTSAEAKILNAIRQKGIKKIEILFNTENSTPKMIKITEENRINEYQRLSEIILKKGYQDIVLTTQKGEIVSCSQTTKHKL